MAQWGLRPESVLLSWGDCKGVSRAGRDPGGIAGALQRMAACCFSCARHQGQFSRFPLGWLSQTRWKPTVFPHALPGCSAFLSLLSQALNSLTKSFNSLFICFLGLHNYSCCWDSKVWFGRPPAQPVGKHRAPSASGTCFLQSDCVSQWIDLPFSGPNKYGKAQLAPLFCSAAWANEQQPAGSSKVNNISLGKNCGWILWQAAWQLEVASWTALDWPSLFAECVFSGLVIFKGIDFNVFSLDGDLTAEELAPRRNGIPWTFTSACLDWKLRLSMVPRKNFVDENRSLDPSRASAERMSHLFEELSSSPWTGAILSETISNTTQNSHGCCTAPWQRTDFKVHKPSGDCQIFVSWWIIDIRKCLQLSAHENLWGAPEPVIPSLLTNPFLAGRCLQLGQLHWWVMLIGKAQSLWPYKCHDGFCSLLGYVLEDTSTVIGWATVWNERQA